MDYSNVAYQAKHYTDKLGFPMLIISGVGIVINRYFSNLMPSIIVDGMYWILFMSVIGMAKLSFMRKASPYIVAGGECPKCQSFLEHTGQKCSNDDCDYRVDFD